MKIRGPRLGKQTVHIVGPAFGDLAAQAENASIRRVRVVVLARAALDVSSCDTQLRIAILNLIGGAAGASAGASVRGVGVTQHWAGQDCTAFVSSGANHAELRSCEVRIHEGVAKAAAGGAAVYVQIAVPQPVVRIGGRTAAEEGARRCVKTAGLVVHEREFGIRLGVLVEFQLAEKARRIAVVIALQVMACSIIESRVSRHDRASRIELVPLSGKCVIKHRGRRVARAAAGIRVWASGAHYTSRMISMVSRGRVRSTVAQVALHVPRAIGEILAHDDREFFVAAIPVRARNRREAPGRQQRIEVTLMVAVVVDAGVGIQAHALEMIVHDEVDHAANGICAVCR